ncbi:glycoside hydrolase family 3 N-terminal domain-containing protein [Maricurvus nonylphenolicus]|uniref:glycoside hydrolase family 3 protein n=1 Tax=Maricurvus nonylphenolicus TaxID=1008307 RepID=UPI0036F2398F
MKYLKYSLYGLGLTLLLAITLIGARSALFLHSESQLDKQIPANQFDAVATLEHNGIKFRDLNKNGQLDTYENPQAELEARIQDLISQMTIAEKVGLMFHTQVDIGPNGSLTEPAKIAPEPAVNLVFEYTLHNNLPRLLVARHINHFNVINSVPAAEMIEWHNTAQAMAEKTRLGIPVSFSSDPRHSYHDAGLATSLKSLNMSQWPEAIGLAALDDPAITEQFGRIANLEYRSVGLRAALHPMADLATEPRWGRTMGTFGEDADLASRHLYAYIQGFQGKQLDDTSVITVTKHFPGGGAVKDGYDTHLYHGRFQAYPGDNFDYHVKPFEAAFAAGSSQIMTAYGVPTGQTDEEVAISYNSWVLTDLLRNKLGFDGVALSDWGVITPRGTYNQYGFMPARAWGVLDLSVKERFVKALDAGIDQFGGEFIVEPLVELVEEGVVAESRINLSVTRILRDKFRLGLFDNPYVSTEDWQQHLKTPDAVALAEQVQRQSQVLLKNTLNSNQVPVLPLQQNIKLYIEGLDADIAANYAHIVQTPEAADFAILRLRTPVEPSQIRSSLMDTMFDSLLPRGDLDFKGEDLAHIRDVMSKVPTVVSIYLERPAVIPEIAEEAAALIANFSITDKAILDVVFGKDSPKGKLPFELPASMAAVESQFEDQPYDSKAPLFPFGFGLSYAQENLSQKVFAAVESVEE